LLDEPTAHLDLAAQLDVLELTVRLNRERGLTVLAAIHDLNLAALYFPRLVLLANGSVVADGPPDEVVRPELVWRVYGAGVQVERHPTRPVPHVVLLPRDGAAPTAGARWRDDWPAGEDSRTTLPGSLR
jgi:iron complex transport system ATP-binding protein